MKKQLRVFVYIKYGKFLSVLPGHFIKHKPHISEEWGHKNQSSQIRQNTNTEYFSPLKNENPNALPPGRFFLTVYRVNACIEL